GYFAALIRSYCPNGSVRMLDFGCGLGKLAPVSTAFTQPDGQYLGIDIRPECIDFCRRHYAGLPCVSFFHSGDQNATYSDPIFATVPGSGGVRAVQPRANPSSYGADWPVPDATLDVIVSVSVFTHLNEKETQG